MSVFNHAEYKAYLKERLGSASRRTGAKAAAARAIGCHTTYFSQVLNDRADLSLEQAESLNRFLGHTEEESEFFLLLVSYARAGTRFLREHFQRQIDRQLEKRLSIKERVGKRSSISPEDEAQFYSSWLYGATHVLVSIPALQEREALARYLNLPLERVTEILTLLEKVGLIEQNGKHYAPASQLVHLGADSANVSKHHTNWRLRALRSLESKQPNDLHYSAAVSLSQKDVARIKDNMITNLKANLDVIATSKEEAAYAYCFDFFELKA